MRLRRLVVDGLAARGYRHVRVGIHLRPISPDVSAVVDTEPLGGSNITPAVGLRFAEVEELTPQLMELRPAAQTSTVLENVGKVLGGDYTTWWEPDDLPVVMAAIERASAVMAEYARLELLPALWERLRWRDPEPFTPITVMLLLGNDAEVRRRLAEAERLHCAEPGPICDQFRRFQRNLELERARRQAISAG